MVFRAEGQSQALERVRARKFSCRLLGLPRMERPVCQRGILTAATWLWRSMEERDGLYPRLCSEWERVAWLVPPRLRRAWRRFGRWRFKRPFRGGKKLDRSFRAGRSEGGKAVSGRGCPAWL